MKRNESKIAVKQCYKDIIRYLEMAQECASSIGITDLFHSCPLQELLLAEKLGHIWSSKKREYDAYEYTTSGNKCYEYKLGTKHNKCNKYSIGFDTPTFEIKNLTPLKFLEILKQKLRIKYSYLSSVYIAKRDGLEIFEPQEISPSKICTFIYKRYENRVKNKIKLPSRINFRIMTTYNQIIKETNLYDYFDTIEFEED